MYKNFFNFGLDLDLCSTQLHSQKTSPNIGNSFEKKVLFE